MSQPLHIVTPTYSSTPLNQITGKNILLKMECYQPVGSFKIRGVGRRCQELIEQGHDLLVSSSGGNAGYTVAYVGRQLGIKVKVFVPKPTNPVFLNFIKQQGAEIIIEGDAWDEANQAALKYVEQHKAGFVPPFDHPTIWAGNSTIIDEIVQQCAEPDAIIAAVGGGGLMLGILQGLEKHGWNKTALFSAETEGAASLAASIKANKLVTLEKITSIATTLGAKRVAPQLFDWTRKRFITPFVVSDHAALIACQQFVDDHHVLVEPACGAPLSVIYDYKNFPELADMKSILVIVCGGVGISLNLLNEYLAKY